MSYRGHREKNSDEHNTVRRYRADSDMQHLPNISFIIAYRKELKGLKGVLFMENPSQTTERNLPYGITHPTQVLDLPTPEVWKAELI